MVKQGKSRQEEDDMYTAEEKAKLAKIMILFGTSKSD